jgi:hypothetical protein
VSQDSNPLLPDSWGIGSNSHLDSFKKYTELRGKRWRGKAKDWEGGIEVEEER